MGTENTWFGVTTDSGNTTVVALLLQSNNLVGVDFGEGRGYHGYLVVGEELRPLPIGSTLNPKTGIFSWMPGPGFLGTYDLFFLQTDEFGNPRRIPVKITIRPKFEKH